MRPPKPETAVTKMASCKIMPTIDQGFAPKAFLTGAFLDDDQHYIADAYYAGNNGADPNEPKEKFNAPDKIHKPLHIL